MLRLPLGVCFERTGGPVFRRKTFKLVFSQVLICDSYVKANMPYRFWAILFALIIAVMTLDFVVFEGKDIVFVLRKMNDLVEWLAFWR